MQKCSIKVNSGGGFYEKQVKSAKWIDLDDGFEINKQVIHRGEYYNGLKVGRWDINFRRYSYDPFQKIGGGSYEFGVKFGKWIDLDDDFKIDTQIIHTGEYKNGLKVGLWVEMERNVENMIAGFKKNNEIQYQI